MHRPGERYPVSVRGPDSPSPGSSPPTVNGPPITLFGSQQFSLGGWGSVRGFKDTGLAGETGLAVQNTLQYTLNQPWTLKAPLILSAFVDIGAVYAQATGSTHTLGGAGLALRYAHPWFTFHLTWANAWHRPESLAAEPPPLSL